MTSGSWHVLAETLTKRDSLGLAAFDELVYAVGGYNNIQNRYLNSMEVTHKTGLKF